MSGASWQEGAGGGRLVGGLQDGGRVNNTQLIAAFPSSWRRKKKERNIVRSSERAAEQQLQQLQQQKNERKPAFIKQLISFCPQMFHSIR